MQNNKFTSTGLDSNNLPSICPYITNLKPFLVDDHPQYHPDTKKYDDYWSKQEQYCIEGFYGEESANKWRYMPPQLYYYRTFCVIEDESEEGNSIDIIKPLVRDVEWLFFYAWLRARGFSGLEDDEDFTCNDLVYKIEKNITLSTKDQIRLKSLKHIRKPDGSYKKYINWKQYLFKLHEKPLGAPVYENIAKNLMGLTARRQGKSFWLMAIISHAFKFHGAIRYDDAYLSMKKGPEIVVGSVLGKSADMLKKFSFNEEYQKNNFGSWGENDDFEPGYFYSPVMGSLQISNNKSPYRNEYEVTEGGVKKKKGRGTKIIHVTYESNDEAAVGTGPIISIVEEVGLMSNLLRVHSANETTLIRRNKFGSGLYMGTAGNLEKIIQPKTIFEDPASYDMLEFEDEWEKRDKPTCLFIPAYYVDNTFRDPNGNQNIQEAYEEIMGIREEKAKSSDPYTLAGWVMARPVKISEMFLSGVTNRFPVIKLQEQYTEVTIKQLFKKLSSKGELIRNDKDKVVFVPDLGNKFTPITETNSEIVKQNIKGSLVFYEHPEANIPNPLRKISLYKIVYDPYRDDESGTSLASIIVYKSISEKNWALGLQDDIVAEYIGRSPIVDDIHNIAINLALYYNAKILVETNVPDFLRYCRREGYTRLLQETPHETISKVVNAPVRKHGVGVDMTSPALHEHAEQLLNQWLLTPWKIENNKEYLNLNKIKSPRILLELMQYDPAKNRTKSDHIASFKLLALWLAQEKNHGVKNPKDEQKSSIAEYYRKHTPKNASFIQAYYNY